MVKENPFSAKYELDMSSGAFYEQFKSYEVLQFSPFYLCSHYWPYVVKHNNILKRSQNGYFGKYLGYFNRIRAISEQNKSTSNLKYFEQLSSQIWVRKWSGIHSTRLKCMNLYQCDAVNSNLYHSFYENQINGHKLSKIWANISYFSRFYSYFAQILPITLSQNISHDIGYLAPSSWVKIIFLSPTKPLQGHYLRSFKSYHNRAKMESKIQNCSFFNNWGHWSPETSLNGL